MDDNKVFDDRPLNDAVGGAAEPLNKYKSTQIPVVDDQIQQGGQESQYAEVYGAPSTFNTDGVTKLNLIDNTDQAVSVAEQTTSNTDDSDFADYYREAQNQQVGHLPDEEKLESIEFNKATAINNTNPEPSPKIEDSQPNNTMPNIKLAPEYRQTYEQSEASARIANQNMQAKNKFKLKGLIISLSIFLILIIAFVVGYFYLKMINTPQYKFKQAADNFSKQKSDINFNYQVKKGVVYEDILTMADKYDANNNVENQISFNLEGSEVKLNIISRGGIYYFKLNGVEAASKELESKSISLSKTVKSTGTVLDDQWVELDGIKELDMPSSLIKKLYPLMGAIDKNSIIQIAKDSETDTYSFKLNSAMVKDALSDYYQSKLSVYFKEYDIKIDDYINLDKISELNYKVSANRKQKSITKFVISTSNEDKIISFNFRNHVNEEVGRPDQSKKFTEISNELEAATSQSGVNIGPLLKSN